MRSLYTTISLSVVCFTISAKQPNIVFLFSDDHATQAIGAYGHELAKLAPTPFIDKIAERGMLFDRCLVGNSICGPSRATILTGTYSHINKFFSNEHRKFDGSQPTFPKILQRNGYQTVLIGKWHLASEPTGFDHWEILPGQGQYYNPDFSSANGIHREKGYVSEIITEKAITWLEGNRDKNEPFLLMVQHKAPHRDWSPAPKYLGAFSDVVFPEPETLFDIYENRSLAAKNQDMTLRNTMLLGSDLKVEAYHTNRFSRMSLGQISAWKKIYDPINEAFKKADLMGDDLVRWKYQRYLQDYLACIKSVDDSVGEIWDWLETEGLLENTIFVYSSDQGFYLGEHGWFDKRFMYDESYRTPLLISWPGVTEPGSVCTNLVSNLDFAQTFLDAAGSAAPARMQGASLVPLLQGDEDVSWRHSHYYHYYEYPGWHMVYRHEGAYDGRYKLIHYYDVDEWELIDMETDPNEMVNQYGNPAYKKTVTRMHDELEQLRVLYQVPPNQPKSVESVTQHYHSDKIKVRSGDSE